MKPLKSKEWEYQKRLLNPKFPYTPSCKTDIRATFERARKELAVLRKQQMREVA